MTLGICGAGTMGSGIAYAAAAAGFDVLVNDVSLECVQRGLAHIEGLIDSGLKRGRIDTTQADVLHARVRAAVDPALLAGCELIVEAIVEDLTVKRDLFARLESIMAHDAILASNTSSLAITAIAAYLAHPERVVGMHFFNPPHIMKLVEIVQGHRTTQGVVERAAAVVQRMGKTAVMVRDTPGFIVNRVARNYYGEAFRIVGEGGADLEQVDRCMKGIGFKMGPFELMDLIGIDINLAVTESIYQQYYYEPRFRPHIIQRTMVESGLLGKKTGGGFYSNDKG